MRFGAAETRIQRAELGSYLLKREYDRLWLVRYGSMSIFLLYAKGAAEVESTCFPRSLGPDLAFLLLSGWQLQGCDARAGGA